MDKYNEALEKAKYYVQSYKDQPNPLTECAAQTVFDIFPELKESEDERIRKEIIEIVKMSPIPDNHDALLAWLEKQKESSHWKPSEEQMQHLLAAQERYALDDMLSSDKTAEVLELLYNDLEALTKWANGQIAPTMIMGIAGKGFQERHAK